MEKQQPLFPPNKSQLEKLSNLHKAMGDRTRMEIIWKLMKHQYCVSALAKEVQLTESAVSHQLRILKIARLVRSYKKGKNVFYVLEDEHIKWILEETFTHILEL